jgi:hypothetical protein
MKTNIILEFNGQKWQLLTDMQYMSRFSKYIQSLIESTDKNSTLYLNGFHFLTFEKINNFCKKHFKDPLPIIYDEWDHHYIDSIRNGEINLQDFVQTCKYFGFNDLVNLFS